jgi:hypothetical protein
MPLSPNTNGIMPNFGVTVPPGDALNTTDAAIKGGLEPTFFADGCRFYVEASSVNGLISEVLNAVNCMGLEYDPDRLDNLCLAIKAVISSDNAPAIVAAICGNGGARESLAACLADNIAAAICNDASASGTLANCITETLNPDDLVARICGDNSAGDALAACMISSQENNQLVQGDDGRLYVASSGGGGVDPDLLWTIRVGLGQVYMVDQGMAGVEIPPEIWNATGPVFVKLTSQDPYNSGNRLINYTTQGSSESLPDFVATAVINVPGPLFGRTIHMLNTEQAILRPRQAEVNGQLQLDQLQWHEHTGGAPAGPYYGLINAPEGNRDWIGGGEPTGYTRAVIPLGAAGPPTTYAYSANPLPVRTGHETRAKNLGVTAYMRVR